VQIPETAPWLAEDLHQLTGFAKDNGDDQVGSTGQLLEWFKKPFPEKNIFEYYRRLAQAARNAADQNPPKLKWAIGPMEWFAAMTKSS
jgi:hypothetical protein